MKKQVSLTIDSDILNAIDETAKAIRRTRSDTVGELLRMLMWVDTTEKFMEQSAGTGVVVKTFAKNLRGA
jgi:metal-responsive CopG/Arc/MetJ family transcriptional regulator